MAPLSIEYRLRKGQAFLPLLLLPQLNAGGDRLEMDGAVRDSGVTFDIRKRGKRVDRHA